MPTTLPPPGPIARLNDPSYREFEPLLLSNTPAVITGAMGSWRAMSEWTLPYLREKVGSVKTPIRDYRVNFEGGAPKPRRLWTPARAVLLSVAEYLDALERGESAGRYLAQVDIPHMLGPIADDIERPKFVNRRALSPVMWIGPGGHKEPLHFDHSDGVLAQVVGRKRVVLFPSSSYDAMYPFPLKLRHPYLPSNFSQLDIDAPDKARFPKFKPEDRVEVILEPGEMLYLPTGWWHEVSCIDPVCVSVTHFHEVPVEEQLRRFRVFPWYRPLWLNVKLRSSARDVQNDVRKLKRSAGALIASASLF